MTEPLIKSNELNFLNSNGENKCEFRKIKGSSCLLDFFLFLLYLIIGVPIMIIQLILLCFSLACKKVCCPTPVTKLIAPDLPAEELKTKGNDPDSKKDFDLIIMGATGFTGSFAVEYLAENYNQKKSSLRWAIAGRSERKLKALIADVKSKFPEINEIPYLVGDSLSIDDMENIAKSTHAISSFVGPFQKYGSLLVRSCIKYGTSYSDSTGESSWMRQMIGLYHDRAITNEVRIVHQCGFDSVPADMVTLLCHKQLKMKNENLKSIRLMSVSNGVASGGTLATVKASMLENNKLIYPQKNFDLLYLTENDERAKGSLGEKSRTTGGTQYYKYHPEIGQYGCFFVLAPGNMCSARRTGAYNQYNDVQYFETQVKSNFFAVFNELFSKIFFGLSLVLPLTSWFFQKFCMYSPGEGASLEVLNKMSYYYNAVGTGDKGSKVYALLGADKDGGYIDTARMVVEAAITCFQERLNPDLPFGILTSGCLDEPYMKQLQKTGTIIQASTTFQICSKVVE